MSVNFPNTYSSPSPPEAEKPQMAEKLVKIRALLEASIPVDAPPRRLENLNSNISKIPLEMLKARSVGNVVAMVIELEKLGYTPLQLTPRGTPLAEVDLTALNAYSQEKDEADGEGAVFFPDCAISGADTARRSVDSDDDNDDEVETEEQIPGGFVKSEGLHLNLSAALAAAVEIGSDDEETS